MRSMFKMKLVLLVGLMVVVPLSVCATDGQIKIGQTATSLGIIKMKKY